MKLPSDIRIGSHTIGYGKPPLLIAEIGINHNGSLLKAKELILKARECGVQVVKFQKRDLASIYTRDLLENLDHYEQGFQYLIPILKKCELSENEMEELKTFTEALGLTFLCTAFDLKSASFLNSLNIPAYKVSSADLTNMPLLEELASFQKPLLISTGMSTDREVRYTVDFLKEKKCHFVLLHCVSSYPVDPQKANLERIRALATEYDSLVGYSGHDLGTSLSLVATSFGAAVIEKHFTLDRTQSGPDHKVSLLPEELQRLAARLREERVNGVSIQITVRREKTDILQGELLNKQVFRKGLVAATDIAKGEALSKENITLKSPGGFLHGQHLSMVYGKTAPYDISIDQPIPRSVVENQQTDSPFCSEASLPEKYWQHWGYVVRYHDFQMALPEHPPVLEFHLTLQDTALPIPEEALQRHREQLRNCTLRVHCCEYLPDRLFDLCSSSTETRRKSFEMLQRVLDITCQLAPYFSDEKPAVIFNCGAMTLQNDNRSVRINEDEFFTSILALRTHKSTLLAQNMPPYPWYYGGQWKGHYFLEAEELIRFCKRTGHFICLDLSHASMAARYLNVPLSQYLSSVKPYVRHMHVSDAKSIEGEGTQIGDGSIDFDEVAKIFPDYQFSWVPEIWQGHLENNAGARIGIQRFASILLRLQQKPSKGEKLGL